MKPIKILLVGEGGVGRTTLLTRYVEGYFSAETKMTIGVQHFQKEIVVENQQLSCLFVDFAGQERWRFYQQDLMRKADGAILTFDLTRPMTLDNMEIWVDIIRAENPDIPIVFVGMKSDLTEYVIVDDEYALQFKEVFNLSDYIKTSCKTGENVDLLFETLIYRVLGLNPPRVITYDVTPYVYEPEPKHTSLQFKINKYITMKLENSISNIYVKDQLFQQCKYLLINIPTEHINRYESIDSIDKASEVLGHNLELSRKDFQIPAEVEFWGHCSNIQAWAEHDYDTRILHRNLAFPLLKKLTMAGDSKAKKIFKEEIAKRLESNHEPVINYLIDEGYLEYLNNEELLSLDLDLRKFSNSLLEKIVHLYISRGIFLKFIER